MANDSTFQVLLSIALVLELVLVWSQEQHWPQPANPSNDVMLGALFPIHEATSNFSDCGRIQMEDGIQPLEALLYTVDKINQQGILPGFRLQLMVLDSCDNVPHALEQSLDFIKGFISKFDHHDDQYTCGDGTVPTSRGKDFGRVIGVIGGQSSQVSIQVANLLRIFHLPQISYLSTSSTLSNKEMFEYFFRTVPSDSNQVVTILEILHAFQWTYVSLVYTNTDYGNKGVEELEKLAPKYNVCFASPQRINVEQFKEIDYDNVIYNLKHKSSAKVVVMFADKKSARQLMVAAQRQPENVRFVWIGSDGWSGRDTVVQGLEEVIEGAITVLPMWGKLNGFDEYFTSLRPNNHPQNPWFAEFWEEYFKCRLPKLPTTRFNANYNECQPNITISTSSEFRQQTYLHFVRDAAYAFAYAVRDMHREKCGHRLGICKAMKDVLSDGRQLKHYLHNVTFKDELNKTFRFQNNGDGPPRYSILNFQKLKPDVYDWVVVGSYLFENGQPQLKINRTMMKFVGGSPSYPTSYCSEPCRQDQIKIQQEGDTCCWVCTNCSTYQIRYNESHCEDCPIGALPNPTKSLCEAIPQEYIEYTNPWAIAAMAIAGFGLLLTTGIGLIFGVYSDTPIIKAAGRELSYILLLGIFLSFGLTFVIVAKPTPGFCGLTRFFLGFCYTLCYSAVVTKTNRIARIFNSKHSTPKKTRYISPHSQVVITMILTSVEVIINTVWLIIYPPTVVLVHPSREDNLLICDGSDSASYLVGLIYPFVLFGFCTVYAFKTRKCPDGFNEARYVAFTNYTTCVLWLAFVPLFFTSSSNMKRTITLSISLTLAGMVQLGCLFMPKIYIVLFKPEKNTKEGVMSQHRSCYMPSSSIAQGASPTFLLNGSCLEGINVPRLGSNASSIAVPSSLSEEQFEKIPVDSSASEVIITQCNNGKLREQQELSTPC